MATMQDILNPAVPAGAYDEFAGPAKAASARQRAWEAGTDGPLPALYIGHGAPPLLDDTEWMGQLASWTHSMPKPAGVLIVSAHWEAAPLMLSAPAAGTPLVYDFGGFAQRYYTLKYETPDAGGLARQVTALAGGQNIHAHASRGLDHGAWVPLKVMYPLADVPVLQLSIPTHDPEKLLKLGEKLRPLREQGVLIIGSGFLTHGLPWLTPDVMYSNTVPGWSREFDLWAADALGRGDIETLSDYRKAPGMPQAHPTADHYLPLFVTLGAASGPGRPVETVIDGYWMGLAKRSFQVS